MSRLNVAVVEDNPDNMFLIEAILEDRFDTTGYADGPSALAGMQQSTPALVLMDISLPGMDGTAVLAAMRKVDALRRVPVIALTAHAMRGDRERLLGLGFDDYLSKPIVDEAELFEKMDALIASTRGS